MMTIHDKIRNEKRKYDFNRDAAKILALSSGKTDKYEYRKGEEILPSNQRKIIKQAFSPLGKAFEKETENTGWCYKIFGFFLIKMIN